jgi:hypothetical protein
MAFRYFSNKRSVGVPCFCVSGNDFQQASEMLCEAPQGCARLVSAVTSYYDDDIKTSHLVAIVA